MSTQELLAFSSVFTLIWGSVTMTVPGCDGFAATLCCVSLVMFISMWVMALG